MNNDLVKKLIPHLAAYFILLAISFVFFSGYTFHGKVLNQFDTQTAKGAQSEMRQILEETGEKPIWTNSMFGGMPGYQIYSVGTGNYVKHINKGLLLGKSLLYPPVVILLAMFMAYLFLVVMKVDWRVALIGAIGYGISTYYMDLATEGHSTKMMALAYVPGLCAAAILTFRGKYILGGSLFGLFTALQIYSNHVQITFYIFLILAILGIIEIIYTAKEGNWNHFIKAASILVIATLIGVSTNLSRLWTTQEYGQETIRGKSELSAKAAKGDGLSKDYIFGWSYGKMESLTFLIPNFYGGGNKQSAKGTETYKRVYSNILGNLQKQGYPPAQAKETAEKQVAGLFYWGSQPFVGASIYFGAIICFLFFVGVVLTEGRMRAWLIAAVLFSLTIAWGKNFFLNEILVDHVPFFNKFRAVSMSLGLTLLFTVTLAALGLQQLMNDKIATSLKQKALYIAAGITGGICLLVALMSGGMNMVGPNDGNFGADLLNMITADRKAMVRADAFRSLALIAVSAGLIWAYLKGMLKPLIMVVAIAGLSLIDLWTVNRRLVNEDKYEKPVSIENQSFQAEKDLLQDTDPHFRVLDLARGNPFADASVSYLHKSIGGYHAAKLGRYQDLIERYLSNPTQNLHIVGMLNGKYILQNQDGQVRAVQNPQALGNAWFVKDYKIVENGDAEMDGLANLKPAETALVQKSFSSYLDGLQLQPDPTATIKLSSYHPDKMVYDYSANTEQLAVFSEVYYPPAKGWNAYLDGQKIDPFIKADWILRAMRLPAGNHQLEMRFEPRSFLIGETISKISSLLLILLTLLGLYFALRGSTLPSADLIPEMAIAQAKAKPQKTVSRKSTNSKKTKKKKK